MYSFLNQRNQKKENKFTAINYSSTIQYLYLLHMRFQFRAKHTNDLVSEWFQMTIQEDRQTQFPWPPFLPHFESPQPCYNPSYLPVESAFSSTNRQWSTQKSKTLNRRAIYLDTMFEILTSADYNTCIFVGEVWEDDPKEATKSAVAIASNSTAWIVGEKVGGGVVVGDAVEKVGAGVGGAAIRTPSHRWTGNHQHFPTLSRAEYAKTTREVRQEVR
jgi:hypothetical protein